MKGTKTPTQPLLFVLPITTGATNSARLWSHARGPSNSGFFDTKSKDYPFVTRKLGCFVQGLAYPDIPSSEQYQPNSIKATARFTTFMDLLRNTPDLDFDAEFQKLVDDLNSIYNE